MSGRSALGFTMAALAGAAHASIAPEEGDACVGATYHLDAPSDVAIEGVCSSFSGDSCCSATTAAIINDATNTTLYNFDYSHCGPISKQCEVFLQMEECFYECSPELAPWISEGPFGPILVGVPICGNFCDEWFAACKDELTCATDWLDFEQEEDLDGFFFNYETYEIYCTAESECLTFAERYGNGEGLCNTMWANSFQYSDQDECLVFATNWQEILVEAIQSQDSQECIGATHHLEEPVANPSIASTICADFSGQACCSTSTANTINDATDTSLYNFDYSHCGPISKECEAFLQMEECFYECSPDLAPYASPGPFGPVLNGIPVCADFCDAWFSACKNDLTCATDWLDFEQEEDLDGFFFNYETYEIYCTEESECLTFAERYGNGEGLCNTMWASTFQYSNDESACFNFSDNWEDILLDKLGEDCPDDTSLVEGDVNGDEELNVLDVVLTVNFILGKPTECDLPQSKLDINSDGTVNILDVVAMVGQILDTSQG